jgi:hypothetical protein
MGLPKFNINVVRRNDWNNVLVWFIRGDTLVLLPTGSGPNAPGQAPDHVFGGTLALSSMSGSDAMDHEGEEGERWRDKQNREESEYGTVKTRGCNEDRVRQAQGPMTYEYHCQAENSELMRRETVLSPAWDVFDAAMREYSSK